MDLKPINTIPKENDVQCKPETCLRCDKRFYCTKWMQYLEDYAIWDRVQFGSSSQSVSLQQPDLTPILDIVQNLQKQVLTIGNELKNIKAPEAPDQERAPEPNEFEPIKEEGDEFGLSVYDQSNSPDTTWVERRKLFGGTKWVEKKVKK